MDIDVELSSAPLGVPCRVSAVGGGGAMKRRLMDLGLVEGAVITPLFAGLGGGLRAYELRGAVIALRTADARLVSVAHGTDKVTAFQ